MNDAEKTELSQVRQAEPDSFTLGEFRQLTADLPDDVRVQVIAPVTENRWRAVGADVSVHLQPAPRVVLIDLYESVGDDGR